MNYKEEFNFLRSYLAGLAIVEANDYDLATLREHQDRLVYSFFGNEPFGDDLYYYAKSLSMVCHAINRYTHGS